MTAEEIIKMLELEPLTQEGGYYKRTYPPGSVEGEISSMSAIYYMLSQGEYSKWHKVASDELFHFYLGDPVELFTIDHPGSIRREVIGQDILQNQRPQVLVRSGTWQASRLVKGGSFALMGTTVSPGFKWEDFATITDTEDFMSLIRPDQQELARSLV